MANENYKRSPVKVINPYTFVPITSQKVNNKKRGQLPNAKDYYQNQTELHTGVLHCTLQVVTPLAIPDIEKMTKDVRGHKSYPFYKDRGKYIIPGSSLRGVLRSVYETVTDSCFSTVKLNGETNLSRRVDPKSAYKPGILIKKNGKLHLYSAKRHLIPVEGYKPYDKDIWNPFPRVSEDGDVCAIGIERGKDITDKHKILKTGDWAHFQSSNKPYYNKNSQLVWSGIVQKFSSKGNKYGIVYLGEPFMKKHGDSIFVISKEIEGTTSESLQKAYVKLKDTLSEYRNKAVNKNVRGVNEDEWYLGFEDIDLESGIPLWYDLSDGIHFSYASIGRTMYNKTLNVHLNELDRCKSREHLCDACLLFGMVGADGDENKGMGSRIRVTDAHVIGSPSIQKNVTLKELGMPRYSYLPFYATYTSAKDSNKKFPESYDDQGAAIAGRKYYWNNEKARNDSSIYSVQNKDRDKTKRNATIDLMKPGAEFQFDVYYDGIKEEQLKKLLWVLTIGQNKLPDQLGENENLLCHKIGHGKPLGLGSVKIVVDAKEERTIDLEGDGYYVDRTEQSAIEIKEMQGSSAVAVSRVASMQPFAKEYSGISIKYPNIVNQDKTEIPPFVQQKNNKLARHQWYTKNRSDKNEGQVLPKIMDGDQTLHQYYYKAGGNGGKRR